jgi:hypothetical protein
MSTILSVIPLESTALEGSQSSGFLQLSESAIAGNVRTLVRVTVIDLYLEGPGDANDDRDADSVDRDAADALDEEMIEDKSDDDDKSDYDNKSENSIEDDSNEVEGGRRDESEALEEVRVHDDPFGEVATENMPKPKIKSPFICET